MAPALADVGVRFSAWEELDEDDHKFLVETFEHRIFPVLTPLAVDPGHPFPYISNLSLNLAVSLRDPVTGETRFARVKVPDLLPRFVVMPDGERFVPLEQVIAAHLDQLFPGHGGRVARHLPGEPQRRPHPRGGGGRRPPGRRGDRAAPPPVRPGRAPRAEHRDHRGGPRPAAAGARPRRRRHLRLEGPLDLGGLWSVHALDRPELKDPVFGRVTQARLDSGSDDRVDMFSVLREGDVLVHHPYDSFRTSVEEFIRQASIDPHVLAIKMTLYRTSGDSPIVRSLIRAAERGKQVAVLVELKARFDESANIEWAKAPGDGRRARRLRPRRPQDAHEDRPGGARRARGRAPLLPHRHRQLQQQDGPHLRGPRPADLRSRHRRRPHAAVQLPHRLRARRAVPHAPRGPARGAGRDRGAHRQRGPSGPGRPARVHHHQDEQPLRRADDRRAVRRLPGGRGGRPHHPRRLLPRPGAARPLRADPRAVDRGPLPRALADLPVRQRRRRRRAPAATSARPT